MGSGESIEDQREAIVGAEGGPERKGVQRERGCREGRASSDGQGVLEVRVSIRKDSGSRPAPAGSLRLRAGPGPAQGHRTCGGQRWAAGSCLQSSGSFRGALRVVLANLREDSE